MKTRTIVMALFALAVLIVGTTGTALANDIRMVRDEGSLTFEPESSYRQLNLRVVGEGQVVQRSFDGDQSAVFSPLEFNLPDGQYSFEITGTPDIQRVTREDVQQARENGSEFRGAVVSGTFRLENGSIVLDDGTPESEFSQRTITRGPEDRPSNDPANNGLIGVVEADQVILDDLIVDGSACVGFDCVNGESFGFDTLRLKENNLRVHFNDTSTTASFPTNDWRLVANDTTNGGANYLGIENSDAGLMPFRVKSGARANGLVVDNARVGFGTLTPAVTLHNVFGNTPTLRLDQDGSQGFGSQIWDVAGNEANFFVRDASNGSTLPFRIFPGAPSNALTVENTGDVGVGTDNPDTDLHVVGQLKSVGTEADPPGLYIQATDGLASTWFIEQTASNGRLTFTDDPAGARAPLKIGAGADNNLLRVGAPNTNAVEIAGNLDLPAGNITMTGTLDVTGSVIVNTNTVHPDFVFAPDYELDSIEEHAAKMWEARHLPALPPAPPGGTGPVEMVSHQMGILEELEKAHIYIEQLHKGVEALKALNEQLVVRLEKLEGAPNN